MRMEMPKKRLTSGMVNQTYVADFRLDPSTPRRSSSFNSDSIPFSTLSRRIRPYRSVSMMYHVNACENATRLIEDQGIWRLPRQGDCVWIPDSLKVIRTP